MSAGTRPVVLTSMFLASNAFSAVGPSVMICISTRFSLTLFALRHFVFFVMTSDASCFHEASLNGPLPMKLPASVNLLPYLSTIGLYTGRNDVCDSCWTNQGWGDTSVIRSVYLFSALMPTACRSAVQEPLPGSQLLYFSAPAMPKNWYA